MTDGIDQPEDEQERQDTNAAEAGAVEDGLEEEGESGHRLPFLVVGIGASAGGTEAFISLFQQLEPDIGMAYVLAPHLASGQKSHLAEILARHSRIPIEIIRDGLQPKVNHAYVLPEDRRVRISRGAFRLEASIPGIGTRPIDAFFRSLAQDQKNHAIGVVLSGMDADGAMGLKSIKGEGGITIVQSPESALYAEMPRSSIASDNIDLILPPDMIATQLAHLGRQFQHVEMQKLDAGEGLGTDQQYARIIGLLRTVAGVDFRRYKPSTIRRRIARRMLLHRLNSLPEYEALLRANVRELRELHEDALINVTRFFRDPEVFESLNANVLPQIFDGRPPDQQVRVWVAGCASGEEVYSLAMCLLEYVTGNPAEPPIQLFGTDASEQNIQKARAGLYPETILGDVSPERLRRFFVKTEKGYQVAKRVRDLCIFARQNLCHDPPFSRIDLISCRNVLIYFSAELQRQVIPTFHYALRPNGFLLLGTSETIREFTELFALIDRKAKIFSKVGSTPTRAYVEFTPHVYAPDLIAQPIPRESSQVWGEAELQRAADRIVLARFGPPGVIVNDRLEILQSRGQTTPFFEMPQGTASLQLTRMAREGIAPFMMDAVRRAIQEDRPVQTDPIIVAESGPLREIRIEALPIHTVDVRPKCYLVLFVPAAPKDAAELTPTPQSDEKDRVIEKMRSDLASTRLYLQSLLEERDAKNQELVSANEEIQSANEELQSTNEELETTKEELQSSNEELQTVNDELQNRNAVLTQTTNDLSNLLNSVNLPVLMLGSELNIRHFTPPAQRLMNVRASDVGRPFGEIRMNLNIEDLQPILLEVLDTLNAKEMEVQDRDGRWHLLRVRPYRTSDNKIEGLVVVLVDIDQLRQSQQELRQARDFAGLVIESVPLPLVVLDLEYRIRTTNEAFERLAKMSERELEKRFLPDLAVSLWGLDEPLRSQLAELRSAQRAATSFAFEHTSNGDSPRVFAVRGRVLQPDGEMFLLVTIEDITSHREAERRLQQEGARLAVEVESATRELGRSREDLRALARSLFTSQEDERRRVARELHDDVSQRLAALELEAAAIGRGADGNASGAREAIGKLCGTIAQLSRDVRAISHRLHPSVIDDLGLAAGLRALTEDFANREKMIATFFDDQAPADIPREVATVLYRIAQEALRNVAKHAGRTHVKITLRGGDGVLRLLRPERQSSGIGADQHGGAGAFNRRDFPGRIGLGRRNPGDCGCAAAASRMSVAELEGCCQSTISSSSERRRAGSRRFKRWRADYRNICRRRCSW